jgi:hypothetical protein
MHVNSARFAFALRAGDTYDLDPRVSLRAPPGNDATALVVEVQNDVPIRLWNLECGDKC